MRAEEKRCPLKRALVKHRAADVARKKRERSVPWYLHEVFYYWHDQARCYDFGKRRQRMFQRRLQRSVESRIWMQQANEWIRNRVRVRRLRLLQDVAWVGIAIAVVVLATMLLTSCGYPCDRETVDVCVYGNVDVAQVERVKGLVETAMDERVGQVTVYSDSGAGQWEPYDQDTGELHIDFSRGCETAYLQLVHGLLHVTAEHRGVNDHMDHTAPGLFRQVPLPNVESAFALSVRGMCEP
jgi:hypothetical protein